MVRCAASTAGVIPRSVRFPASVICNSRARLSRLVAVAHQQAFLHQPIDHPGDGGSVIGNQSGKRYLIDPRIGPDGRKRRVLNGREVISGLPDLGKEDRHRNLLEAARQMSGHLVVVSHRNLRGIWN